MLDKMVHAIEFLECRRGHVLPISFDSNECGCHHNGKPCIIITCSECLKDWGKAFEKKERYKLDKITIPLDKDGMKELEKLRKRK